MNVCIRPQEKKLYFGVSVNYNNNGKYNIGIKQNRIFHWGQMS